MKTNLKGLGWEEVKLIVMVKTSIKMQDFTFVEMNTQVLCYKRKSPYYWIAFQLFQGRPLSSGVTVVGFEVLTTVTTSSSIFLNLAW